MKIKFKKKNLRAVELGGNKFKEACSQEAPPSFLHYIIYYIFSNFFQTFFKLFFCTTTAHLEELRSFLNCKKTL